MYDLTVQAEIQGLVGQERHNVATEAAVSGRLGHPQGVEKVPLRHALQVGPTWANFRP
jgi:hypothetical protein